MEMAMKMEGVSGELRCLSVN